jgi:hypothetical protein
MLFFSSDYSLDNNKLFMERFGLQLKDNDYKSYYMNEFEKAFPYQDEERGLVGNNWFSITLEYCLIPAAILIVFAGINFIMNHYQLVYLKRSLLLFIISLILIFISFINAFFYVDHVNMPEKDIYIFDIYLTRK